MQMISDNKVSKNSFVILAILQIFELLTRGCQKLKLRTKNMNYMIDI